jgi:hypothetical protein
MANALFILDTEGYKQPSEYVIKIIIAFLRQKMLQDRSSLLRYTYADYLVIKICKSFHYLLTASVDF